MSTSAARFDNRDLQEMFGAAAANIPTTVVVDGVSTDTRSLQPGNAFVALVGERFDGHDHIDEAISKGASIVVSQKARDFENTIVVADTLNALGTFGWYHRRRFTCPVIAIAGASGKTSTKDLLAHVLGQFHSVLKTTANHNNQIGTPLTLLQLDTSHEFAVIEIGTNEPGEIETLAAMVQPTHGVITTIGEEHLEKLIDLDGVEKEETALFDYLREHGGLMFVNMDDDRLRKYSGDGSLHARTFTYGVNHDAMVKPTVTFTATLNPVIHLVSDTISFRAELQGVGYAAALNATAVTAMAYALQQGSEVIKRGLSTYQPAVAAHGYARMVVQEFAGVTLLNDTYNANPQSMEMSLRTLSLSNTKRIAVLADMRELGDASAQAHKKILELASTCADVVLLYGPEFEMAASSFSNRFVVCASHHQCATELHKHATAPCTVLVKGSRGLEMEHVVEQFAALVNS